MTRRQFCGVFAAGVLGGCRMRGASDERAAQLTARPNAAGPQIGPGIHRLELRRERDALLYVPKLSSPGQPAPLVLYLHGATGSEQQGVKRLSALADTKGFLILSPASGSGTWDAIRDGYGPDVRAIDEALRRTFRRTAIQPGRVTVSGFSDGATYALGLGLSNGDLFTHVMAFSPGFTPPGTSQKGRPRVFVSHGTEDTILPIDSCSRRLVPQLKMEGYKVTYREFNGPHSVPPEIAGEALDWFET